MKTFDCVEMKRQGAAEVYETVKDMTPEEEVEFWRQQTEAMKRRQAEAIAPGERQAA